MFTISRPVTNNSDKPVTLYPYGLISRWGTPPTLGYYILHEGPIGVLDGHLEEWNTRRSPTRDASSFDEHRRLARHHRQVLAGLAGAASRTDAQGELPATSAEGDRYQTDYRGAAMTVAPGQTVEVTDRLFAGAKVVTLLDQYRDQLRHPAVRPRGRLRLVLLPDQADLLRPALHPRRRRQLRHRHPDPDPAGQGAASSRSPTSPTGPWPR